MPKFEDLKFFMNDNECISGVDENGNVYALSFKTGELKPLPKGKSIDPYWGGCTVEYAKRKQAEIKAGLKVA
ncbi:MAG: hypothetical protein K2I95_10495 [Treponemataceae bacterium]|nr:hypothetical protein [Treponemataceae bacterium]